MNFFVNIHFCNQVIRLAPTEGDVFIIQSIYFVYTFIYIFILYIIFIICIVYAIKIYKVYTKMYFILHEDLKLLVFLKTQNQ